MNFEGLGVSFLTIYAFPKHFRQSEPKKEHRAGPMGWACEGAIILAKGIIRFLCTSSYASPMLYIRSPDALGRGCANFREFLFYAAG